MALYTFGFLLLCTLYASCSKMLIFSTLRPSANAIAVATPERVLLTICPVLPGFVEFWHVGIWSII